MYIQLGNLSEDILKDRLKSYENGLPKGPGAEHVDTTAWGRVSNLQQINSAFETDADVRKYQDVGYDGLGPVGDDGDERSFFDTVYIKKLEAQYGSTSIAYQQAVNDPSNDNFKFYVGDDLDNVKADIIQRYKRYNNVQGNTPVSTNSQTNGYGSPNPDDEDVNRDFAFNNVSEQYFEYKISLRPEDLTKDRPNTKNYITNVMLAPVTLKNGKAEKVHWYQFKIPVTEFTRRFGTIPDFRSIQFMRMFMHGFSDSVVLRFGQLQLVRGEWRPYLFNLQKPGEYIPVDDKSTEFIVSSVNLERNASRKPVPYVTPPGIQRTIDFSTPDQIQQNEQSLSMRVCNLPDGDARGVFKNTTFDIRLYKKLKMFVHAEGDNLRDDQMSVFVRIGTDLNSNFYEYEMPLKITPNNTNSKEEIWPFENNIEILLSDFYRTKQQRNVDNVSLLVPYSKSVGKARFTVLGNPDLSNLKTILIGVRNPKNDASPDGQTICGEVWVNELRVTDFDEQGGWALNTTARAKLADFGLLTGSFMRRTIGFGALEQSVQEREQKDTRGYDFSAALELGKLVPANWYLKIPAYYSYGETILRPRFNPLTPDLPFDEVVNSFSEDRRRRDSVLAANQDFTSRTSLNFTNVQKTKSPTKKTSWPWDIENFYLTYSYGEVFRRNIEKSYDIDRNYKGLVGYQYNFTAKNVQPFKKLSERKGGKYLSLLTDFNFYYLPQSWAVSIEGNRRYGEILYRNTDNYKAILEPLYDKAFRLDRRYDFRFNLTKSMKLTYTANGQSYVPEPFGAIDTRDERQQIWDSLKTLGKLNNFNQTTNLTYDVPIAKLPFMDWTSLQTNYTGTYDWRLIMPAAPQLGNVISNSATINANAQLNLTQLYNKSKYLRNVVSGRGNAPQSPQPPAPGAPRTGRDTAARQPSAAGTKALDALLRAVTSVRNISFSYTQSDGMALPGFLPTPKFIGLSSDSNRDYRGAPGLPFVLGFQEDVRPAARRNGWITRDTNLSSFFLTNHSVNLTGQATVEPLKNLRINVDVSRRESKTLQESFRFRGGSDVPESFGTTTTGNYSVSILPIATTFSGDKAYQRFEQEYRRITSERLAAENPRPEHQAIDPNTGYKRGFGKNSQDVMLYAFQAAYMGKDPDKIKLTAFPQIPLPNWRVNYTGLSNLEFVKRYAKNVTITHGYRSTYTVGNYISSINYSLDSVAATGQNLRPEFVIDNVSMQEDFSPLFGIDVSWTNKWTTRFEYKKSRSVALAFTNYQVSELFSEEFTIGAGYRTNKFLLPFKVNRRKTYLTNDLTVRLDFSIRDNQSKVRIVDQGTEQATAGQQIISIKPTIDYALSKSLLLRIFWTTTITNPHVTTQYPTRNTNAGFSLRYTLTP